jgi:hypothetical protein
MGSLESQSDELSLPQQLFLSSKGLQCVESTRPEGPFSFFVGGTSHCCDSLIAEFLSPRISRLRSTDSTIFEFCADTPDPRGYFARVLALGSCGCLELSPDLQTKREELFFIRSIADELRKSEIIELCNSELYQLNVDSYERGPVPTDHLDLLRQLGFCSKTDAPSEPAVKHLASWFSDLSERELDSLGPSIFSRVVSHPDLVLGASEDPLFHAIAHRALRDTSCFALLEFVRFEFLSVECIEAAVELLGNSLEFVTFGIWRSLTPRLVLAPREPIVDDHTGEIYDGCQSEDACWLGSRSLGRVPFSTGWCLIRFPMISIGQSVSNASFLRVPVSACTFGTPPGKDFVQ